MSIAIAALVLVGFGIIAVTGLFESHNRKKSNKKDGHGSK